jgi:LysM repeat protein
MERLDSLEASLSMRMDQKVKELDTLHMEARQKTPDKEKILKAPKKKTESRYHEVSAGETLYRISRQYGLTVEELRKLNNISPESVIYVGQKLIISGEKSR